MVKYDLKPVVAALAASLFFVSHANADGRERDLSGYGPAWVGFYVGAHAGVAFNESDFVGGVQAGYNWVSGDILYGIEGDWTALNGSVGSIRGRVGQLMGDKLFYATAGVGLGDASGLVVGGGVDFDLSHRWHNVTAGVEGLYYNSVDDNSCGRSCNGDSSDFVVRARLNYHLGSNLEPLK